MEILFFWVAIWLILILSIWIIIGALWKFVRDFFHNNYSFFDVSFIMAYFIEQFKKEEKNLLLLNGNTVEL